MTRETKVGLVVASSFLCLVGVVVASKLRQGDSNLTAQTITPKQTTPDDKSGDGKSGEKRDDGKKSDGKGGATGKGTAPPTIVGDPNLAKANFQVKTPLGSANLNVTPPGTGKEPRPFPTVQVPEMKINAPDLSNTKIEVPLPVSEEDQKKAISALQNAVDTLKNPKGFNLPVQVAVGDGPPVPPTIDSGKSKPVSPGLPPPPGSEGSPTLSVPPPPAVPKPPTDNIVIPPPGVSGSATPNSISVPPPPGNTNEPPAPTPPSLTPPTFSPPGSPVPPPSTPGTSPPALAPPAPTPPSLSPLGGSPPAVPPPPSVEPPTVSPPTVSPPPIKPPAQSSSATPPTVSPPSVSPPTVSPPSVEPPAIPAPPGGNVVKTPSVTPLGGDPGIPPPPIPAPPTPPNNGVQMPPNGVPPNGVPPLGTTPPPLGAEANITKPKVSQFEVESYVIQPSDTSFEAISKRVYNDTRYANALLQFNRDYPGSADGIKLNPPQLQAGQRVRVPAAKWLEQRYAGYMNNTPANTFVPADTARPVIPAPPKNAVPTIRPPTITGSNTPFGTSAPLARAESGPGPLTVPNPVAPSSARSYRVKAPSQHIIEIAREVLGDGRRWSEIYRLNPSLQPQFPIPGGTEIRLP